MSERPNILVFLTDDHGRWASHCYGARELHTPSMDHLAATGVRMTQAYTPSPVSSPARASFFTGRLPSQHGIHDWLFETEEAVDHPGLTGQTMLPELFSEAGYQTAHVGKWHCGDSRGPKPGVDHWFCYYRRQYPHFGEQHFSRNGNLVVQHGHQSALLTDEAVRFLRERDADRPFFLFVGYTDTHSPFAMHPQRLVDHYRSGEFDDIPDESLAPCHGRAVVPRGDAESLRESNAQYYAAVEMIDTQIGRVLGALDGTGGRDNTLVVYTSDHGHMNGHHGLMCKGNATTPQNFLDESIQVPCLASWPGRIEGGSTRSACVDHCDLFWTLLDAADVGVDDTTRTQINSPGASYLPMLIDPAHSWRDAQFCEYGNARMIRTDRYKYIRRWPGTHERFDDELYDLPSDPRETRNVIDAPAHAEALAALRVQLDQHFDRYEIPERSGTRITEQPTCNRSQPWDVAPE